ncbi:hypothetical protein ACMFMG_007492 [Clarireedia jacksonii]
MFLKRFLPLFSIYTTSVPVFAASWIVPGALWTDAIGTKIDAHGGGVFQYGDTFYWVGQGDSDNVTARMYSSKDLLNWENRGLQSGVESMWRPKVGRLGERFWIYGQVSRQVQPLESSQIVGGYAVTRPAVYLPPNNYSYSDTGMFLDDDGTWYLLTSADHNTVQVNKIHTNGTIGARVNSLIQPVISGNKYQQKWILAGAPYEAPGMIKVDGIYFLIVSGKTAYQHNPNKMFWTTSINGTWTGPFDIAPNTTNTYNSQNTYELAIHGSQRTTYVYMGDQWDLTGSEASNYMWLPMLFLIVRTASGSVLSMEAPVLHNGYPSIIRSITRKILNPQCTENVRLFCIAGEAYIYINGHSILKLSALNSRAGYSKNVPVELILNRGDENVIEFGAAGSQGM